MIEDFGSCCAIFRVRDLSAHHIKITRLTEPPRRVRIGRLHSTGWGVSYFFPTGALTARAASPRAPHIRLHQRQEPHVYVINVRGVDSSMRVLRSVPQPPIGAPNSET